MILQSLRADPRLTRGLTLAFGLTALYVLAHPYLGIEHDALLYALQALRHLYPEALGGDLFFRHGSQDAYTVFPWLYAALIGRVGLGPAAWLLTQLSGIALVAATWYLASAFIERPGRLSGSF